MPTDQHYTVGALSDVNVTASSVTGSDPWTVAFSGSPDLSNIHQYDAFTDSAAKTWRITSVDDSAKEVVVENSEGQDGSPSTGAGTVGRWYNTITAWETARDGNLIARDTNEYADLWKDSAFTAESAALDMVGWTTNGTHKAYILGKNCMDTKLGTGYQARVSGATHGTNLFNLPFNGCANIVIGNFEIYGAGLFFSARSGICESEIYNILCYMDGIEVSGIYHGGGGSGICTMKVKNCALWQMGQDRNDNFWEPIDIATGNAGTVWYVNNVTIAAIGGDKHVAVMRSASATAATAYVKNCPVLGVVAACFSGTFAGGTTNNTSSDGTAPGTNPQINKIAADNFVGGASPAVFDLGVKDTDADIYQTGADLSADTYPVNHDIECDPRPGTPCRGMDELIIPTPGDGGYKDWVW